MNNGHLRGAAAAQVDWVAGVPRSTQFDDTYFSRAGGTAESRHVFLSGNGLPDGWRCRDRFTIVETGFGTGLNFLTTWQAWRDDRQGARVLHYIAIEAFPLRRGDLEQALRPWRALSALGDRLMASYPPPLPGLHRLLFEGGRLCLDLVIASLEDALELLAPMPDLTVDAWYLDGFAPARNPGMWTEGLYSCMATIGRPQSRFATFTAAGSVRRGLTAAGFAVRKVPGHGNKREMLVGELKNPSPRQAPAETPWHLPGDAYPDAGSGNLRRGRAVATRALVLGAGLAGASVASALARRGWQVAVYERATIAAGASGNRQGALYTRLSHRRSALTEFSLHSFIHAVRCYRAMFEDGALEQGVDGELCGAIQLTPDWDEDNPLMPTLRSLPELVIHLEAAEAAGITGLPACPAGLYYPDSGWLNPPAVCRALLNTGDIAVRENCGEMTLQRHGDGWLLVDERGAPVDEAPVAVVACGNASENLLDADWLRLQSIRGQTTLLPSTGPLRQLNTVICHEGYIAPARGGVHSVGATFDIDDPEPELRPGDHRANLDQLGRALPCLAQAVDIETRHLGGRTGFRCASPDYLPVVGPVPSMADFCRDYAALRRNAKRTLAHPGSYRNGLYVSTGHGSRGLTSTPLTAELLAAQIAGEPWPVSVPLGRALSPARFLVRGLGRGLL